MLESFSIATFAPHRGETFRLIASATEALDLTLAEVQPLGPAALEGSREPFSLLFRGPASPFAPQRTYRFAHATLGEFDLFIVPLGPDATGQRYEAVFG